MALVNWVLLVSPNAIALDMARYHVRSNCIAPSAWSRMTGSVPTNTPEQKNGQNNEAGYARKKCSNGSLSSL